LEVQLSCETELESEKPPQVCFLGDMRGLLDFPVSADSGAKVEISWLVKGTLRAFSFQEVQP